MTFEELLMVKGALSNAGDWIDSFKDAIDETDEEFADTDSFLLAIEEAIELLDEYIQEARPND